MTADTKQAIEEIINSEIEGSEDTFLVEVKVLPGNNIKVFLDADNGITIEKCSKINRGVYRKIEEKGLFPNGDFSLEVSSPGVDEPLRLRRQYKKNIGRTVEVTMSDGTKQTGKLISVNENELTLEKKEGQGKKSTTKTINILFDQVKHTKVLVTF